MFDWKDSQLLANAELQKLNVERVGRAREQAREADGRADNYRAMYLNMVDSNDELYEANDALRAENNAVKQQNAELQSKVSTQEKTILRQKELLREWMISQMAFKNLFKKYGRLPDGRTPVELTEEERLKLINEEEKNPEILEKFKPK